MLFYERGLAGVSMASMGVDRWFLDGVNQIERRNDALLRRIQGVTERSSTKGEVDDSLSRAKMKGVCSNLSTPIEAIKYK